WYLAVNDRPVKGLDRPDRLRLMTPHIPRDSVFGSRLHEEPLRVLVAPGVDVRLPVGDVREHRDDIEACKRVVDITTDDALVDLPADSRRAAGLLPEPEEERGTVRRPHRDKRRAVVS